MIHDFTILIFTSILKILELTAKLFLCIFSKKGIMMKRNMTGCTKKYKIRRRKNLSKHEYMPTTVCSYCLYLRSF